MVRNLPEVAIKDLSLWDDEHDVCGGYLSKKASQTSTFSKGKWQRRWCEINLDVKHKSNYTFEYAHTPEDKQRRKAYPLSGATIKISGDASFVLSFTDGTTLSLSTESGDLLRDWMASLEAVITVSNMRDRMMENYDTASAQDGDDDDEHDDEEGELQDLDGSRPSPRRRRQGDTSKGRMVHQRGKVWPTLRIDQDVSSIPPGTIERYRFVETFCADIANALNIDNDLVEVVSIKPAPGMDWLSLVEFDINLWSAEFSDAENDDDQARHKRQQMVRKQLLEALFDMVNDTSSALYNGYITSKVDPAFVSHILERDAHAYEEIEAFSSDPEIMKIMQRYKDIHVPEYFNDNVFFTITIYYEGRIAKLNIPNPDLLTKRHCALWPFEVKMALGFIGTMQELWIEPLELVPRDSTMRTQPILFSPSVRLNGHKVINAVHLKPDAHYDVKCEDLRDDALNSLSKEEMDEIKEIFQQCDLDGDGGISKIEMENIVRQRTHDRKAVIEKKFKKYVTDNELTKEDIALAELNKMRYIQQLQEAQARLLMMFEAADLNGDGVISFTEFILAEAWWLRCTINPSKAHLF